MSKVGAGLNADLSALRAGAAQTRMSLGSNLVAESYGTCDRFFRWNKC